MKTIPVIIVGGGPVGMTLALALAQQGVRSVLFNNREGTTTHPRLDVINPRTLEIFRRLGISDAVRAAGNPLNQHQAVHVARSYAGEPVWKFDDETMLMGSTLRSREIIKDHGRDGSYPLEPMHRISQMRLEPVLKAAVDAHPLCEILFGWEVHDIEEQAGCVTVHAENVKSGEQRTVIGQYLAGCDGPESITRRRLGVEYLGLRDLVGEIFTIHLRSKALQNKFVDGIPPWHVWSINPHWRAIFVNPNGGEDYVVHKGVPPAEGQDLHALVQEFIQDPDIDQEILLSSVWKPQFIVAESYGRGRIWIVGDAGHQYMPTGGMGLNTGLSEAYNLAWKLVAMVKGWGGDALLESYGIERQPVAVAARDHVRLCAAAVLGMMHGENEGPHVREPIEERAPRIERLYNAWGAEFGYCYANDRDGNSPIIDAGNDPLPFYDHVEYRPTTRAGARLPSLLREDGEAVFDLLDREGFTLLDLSAKGGDTASLQAAAKQRGVPMKLLRLAEPYARDVYAADYVLVRPDEFVAWRGNALPDDPLQLIDRVRGARHV